jgi:hypothetical protein
VRLNEVDERRSMSVSVYRGDVGACKVQGRQKTGISPGQEMGRDQRTISRRKESPREDRMEDQIIQESGPCSSFSFSRSRRIASYLHVVRGCL